MAESAFADAQPIRRRILRLVRKHAPESANDGEVGSSAAEAAEHGAVESPAPAPAAQKKRRERKASIAKSEEKGELAASDKSLVARKAAALSARFAKYQEKAEHLVQAGTFPLAGHSL